MKAVISSPTVTPQSQITPATEKGKLHMIWVTEKTEIGDRLVAVWTTQD
jgi:hypothetical protein